MTPFRLSDYGVPTKVLQYYENEQEEQLKINFDDFEKKALDNVESMISRKVSAD